MTMMAKTFDATECIYQVDDDWVDETRYLYRSGEVFALCEPVSSVADGKAKIEKAIEIFRLSAPQYELLERRSLERPVRGAELLAHRIGGDDVFEIAVFWPIDDTMWAFRVRGPLAAEDSCRDTMQGFLESYEPVETP